MIEDLNSHLSESTNAFVGYFYCDYKSDEKTLSKNILRSLLGQLISGFQPPIPPSVADVVDEYYFVTLPHTIPLIPVISQLVKEYRTASFIIDGLDECRDRAEILLNLQQLSGCVRLFVTSRDEDDIRESLRAYRKHELFISVDHTRVDIERFVVGTLENHIRTYPSFVRDRSIIDEVNRAVVAQAGGM